METGTTAIVWCAGAIAYEMAILILNAKGGSAREFYHAVKSKLEEAGWHVETNLRVDNRGDGRAGFVNMRATKGGYTTGIELDRSSARAKSVTKLQWLMQQGEATGAVVAVRDRVHYASPTA